MLSRLLIATGLVFGVGAFALGHLGPQPDVIRVSPRSTQAASRPVALVSQPQGEACSVAVPKPAAKPAEI